MIENRVNKVLNEKEWSFADLQDMNGLVNDIATMLYDEMSAKDKLELIWEDIGEDFYRIVSTRLKEQVAIIVKDELMNANVNFNREDNKNEISKRSVGGKPSKKRTSNEKTNSEE